jgi:hypothetical protein
LKAWHRWLPHLHSVLSAAGTGIVLAIFQERAGLRVHGGATMREAVTRGQEFAAVRFSALKGSPNASSPTLAQAQMKPYRSLRTALNAEAWKSTWAARFMRPGFLLIVLFEIACLATSVHFFPTLGARALPFELFNLLAGFVCLSITWTLWFDYHWRASIFGFCAIVLVTSTYVGIATGRTEPLFMSVILLLVGAGSLVPWNVRWQAALTALCLGWLALNALWVPFAQPDGLYRWLGLLAAAGLAHFATAMKERYQEDLKSQVRALEEELARFHSV